MKRGQTLLEYVVTGVAIIIAMILIVTAKHEQLKIKVENEQVEFGSGLPPARSEYIPSW